MFFKENKKKLYRPQIFFLLNHTHVMRREPNKYIIIIKKKMNGFFFFLISIP